MVDGNLLGGGVVMALAALLWLVYLVPTWLRRREYMATERNAVRLQQTLRILAEAAEVPEEVHVEANARTVAEQQKRLRKVQQRAIAEAKERAAALAAAEERALAERRAAAEAQQRAEAEAAAQARAWAAAEARARIQATRERVEAAERKARAAGAVLPATVARSVKRGRMVATSVLAVGVVLMIVGAVSGWLVAPLLLGAALSLGALVVHGRLAARVAEARKETRVLARRAAAPAALYDHAEHAGQAPAEAPEDEVELEESEPWTPRPLPRPLHLSRGTVAASTMASISAAAELRRAANRAELEERARRLEAERNPLVAKFRPAAAGSTPEQAKTAQAHAEDAAKRTAGENPAAQAAPAASAPLSKYARMGIVAEQGAPALDLDQALARRRAG
ncbi:hypothetical protein [Gryllotalpicola ginsengisoli]|uniref:hypothetical protein n=1 Tax=Gryllotalpicola ginsengisoli TaxID=444608 RepID=UPI0003B3C391|nr:hypothetical protein [Gryllotalpicola ginsengisoli]